MRVFKGTGGGRSDFYGIFFLMWGRGGALRGGEQRGFPAVSLSPSCSVVDESRAERPRSASSSPASSPDLQLPHNQRHYLTQHPAGNHHASPRPNAAAT